MEPMEVIPAPQAKLGRPTDYRDEYCKLVVEHCAKGKTLTHFAASIDTSMSSVKRWMDAVPAFRAACERARHKMQAHWEDVLAVGVSNRNYNANAILNTLSLLTDDFRPLAQRIELTGADGGPLQIKRSVTDEQLIRLAAQVLDVEHTALPGPEPAQDKPVATRDKLQVGE